MANPEPIEQREPSCFRDVLEFLDELTELAADQSSSRPRRDVTWVDWEDMRWRANDLQDRLSYVTGESLE